MEGEWQIANSARLWPRNANRRRWRHFGSRSRCVAIILILVIDSSIGNIPIQIFLRVHLGYALPILDR